MSTIELIRQVCPEYDADTFELYSFWSKNMKYLDKLIDMQVALPVAELEVEALKRLGKIDLLFAYKKTVINTNELIKTLQKPKESII